MFKHIIVGTRLKNVNRLHPRISVSYSSGDVKPSQSTDSDGMSSQSGKRRGSVFLKLLGITVIGVGGTATVCYLNADVREQLKTSVPYFKEMDEMVSSYLSNMNIPGVPKDKSIDQGLPKVKQVVGEGDLKLPKSSKLEVFGNKDSADKKTFTSPVSVLGKDPSRQTVEKKTTQETSQEKSKSIEVEDVNTMIKKKEKEEEKQKRNAEMKRKMILDDINRLSFSSLGSVQNAISAQINLETKIRQHTSQLKKALDDDGSQDEIQDSLWDAVNAAYEARMKALTEATETLSNANQEIDALQVVLDSAKKDKSMASNDVYLKAQKKVIQSKYDLSIAIENARKAEAEASSVLIYQELIEKGKRQFLKEIEGVKQYKGPQRKDGKLTEDDWNLLIAHAYKRLEQLRKRVLQLELSQKNIVESAVNFQRATDEELTEQRLSTELHRQRQEFELEKQKWNAKAREAYEVELRESLARQAAAHNDHLVQVLRVQREEQNRQFALESREMILRERESFQAAIEKWISRVKGLEAAVDGRAHLERQSQLSQALWLACQNFADSIVSSENSEETVSLKDKILAVKEAANEDSCVTQILAEISPTAADRGILPVDALRNRFHRVKTICKRVAMLDETGGTISQFLLSWIQSLFIFEQSLIYGPADELNSEEMDTFTLLTNADDCVRNGELEMALKFMCQLKGLSRIVASDWINECRLTLEAQLIARTLMAFAGDRSARAILKG